MKKIFLSAILVFSFNAFSHEGAHGPEQKMAPHGGVLSDGKGLMAELVQDASGVKIYLLSHDSKPIFAKNVKLDQKSIQLTDAKKKSVSFELLSEEESVLLKFDKSKSYRYTLTLPVVYNKVTDKLTWQFEPQSN